MTDRLSLTKALADANIDRQKAERIATEIFDAIHDNVATTLGTYGLGAEVRATGRRLEARFNRAEMQLGSLMVALTAIILAAIRYLPRS
jgi:hypothetical protein